MFTYNPYYQPQMNRYQPIEYQQYQPSYPQNPQSYQQSYQQVLQGKAVESVDVVKALDIPLDGSISYFPTTDGTAIVTKQLQKDGTSRTVVYKPTVTHENALQSNLESNETNYIKEELKSIKTQIQAIANSLKGVDKNEPDGNVTESNE